MNDERNGGLVLFALIALAINFLPTTHAEDGGDARVTGAVAESYRSDKQSSTAFRAAVAVVDTAATTLSDANLLVCGEFDLGAPGVSGAARKTVTCTPHFSAASATVSVTFYTTWKNTDGTYADSFKKQGPVLFTAPASGSVRNSRYIAETNFFDSTGANVGFFVVSTAPSSGNVSLFCGSQ